MLTSAKKVLSWSLALLATILVVSGTAGAAQYSSADYYFIQSKTEKVFNTIEFDDVWGDDEWVYWTRYASTAGITLAATGDNIPAAEVVQNSGGETRFYQNDVSGITFYRYMLQDPEEGAFIRDRYSFVTAPTGAPTVADFAASNLQAPALSFPATLDTTSDFTATFASIKYDLNGANPTGYRVEEHTLNIDDAGWDLSITTHPEYQADFAAAWATTGLLQGELKTTLTVTMTYTTGKQIQLVRTDYRKTGVGIVLRKEVYTNLVTGTIDDTSVHQLVKYDIGSGATTGQVPVLVSQQLQVQDGTGSPVTGSYAYGVVYDRDEFGNIFYNNFGMPSEEYATVAFAEDTPGSGLFTLYFYDEGLPVSSPNPDKVSVFYGADGYVTHVQTTPDLVEQASLDSPSLPTYTLSDQAISVTFHVQNEAGDPLVNADVMVAEDNGTTGGAPGAGMAEGVTDSSGNVTLSLSPTITSYNVRVHPEDGSPYLGGLWQSSAGLNDATVTTVNVNNNWPGNLTGFNDGDTVYLVLGQGITLSGTVTNGAGGIEGVFVVAEPEWDPVTGVSTGSWAETTTDSSGNYSMTVSPGSYKINFQTDYWDWETGQSVTVAGGYIGGFADGSGGLINDWMLANVFDIQANTTVNATLTQGITISGVVVDSNYAPITTPMSVNVHSTDYMQWYWTEVATDGSGSFSITVEPGSTYAVEFWPGWDPVTGIEDSTYGGGSYIVHPDPSGTTGTNPLFEAGYDVNDPSTYPVLVASNVTQTLIDQYHNTIDPSGALVTSLTAAGLQDHISGMVMNIWDEHIVTGLTVDQGIKILAQVEAGAQVKGRLVDESGAGIANAWVNAMVSGTESDSNGCFTLSMPTSDILQGSVSTFQVDVWPGWDSTTGMQDSSFLGGVVTDDGAGNYTITPMWEQATQFDMGLSDWPGADLSVCESGATGLLISADVGVTISGTVVNGTGPVANVWVNAWSPDSYFGNGAVTATDGTYSIPVQGSSSGTTYEVGIWEPNYISPEPQNVTVTDTTGVTGVDFTLGNGSNIKGRVVDADGNPLKWMWVDVYAADYTSWYGASTDNDGNYSVSVPDGTYLAKVEGWNNLGQKAYQTNYYQNTTSELNATPIVVAAADKLGINFRMTTGNSISGTLTGLAQGDTVWLDVWSESTWSWGGTEVTGSGAGSDTFIIKGLAEATDYRLGVWSDSYINGHYGGTPGAAASAPIDWNQATMLDITAGSITGVNIAMSQGVNITLVVDGVTSGDTIDANVWSDSSMKGGWGYAESTGTSVTITITGLDSTVTDYRMWVGDWQGNYKSGFYKGDLSSINAGSLVNWDQATLIDMGSGDLSLLVSMDTGGSIAGTITGLPAGSRAWIDAWSENTWAWGGVEVVANGTGTDTYSIKGLSPATDYRVGLWSEDAGGGYYDGNNSILVSWDKAGRVIVGDGTTNAKDVTGIDMVIPVGRTISGAVSGLAAGEWAWIDAWSDETFSWAGKEVTGNTAYTLKGLKANDTAAGGYDVRFWAEGYVSQKQGPVDLSTVDATGIDFAATTGSKISGSITGLPTYEWVWLDAWSSITDSWAGVSVQADESGNATYTIDGLGDATDYVVSLSSQSGWFVYSDTGAQTNWDLHTDVAASGGATTSGIDFAIGAISTYSLSGTVSGLADDEVVDIYAWGPSGWGWTTINGNGTYTINGLPGGDYTVEVWAAGYVTQRTTTGIDSSTGTVADPTTAWTTSWSDVGTVDVSQDVAGLDVVMGSGNSISGQVTTDGTTGVPYVWVNVWSAANGFGNGAVADVNGNYTIEGLPDATDYVVEVWTANGYASLVDVTVAGAPVTGQDMVVTKEAGSIGGTVTSSSVPDEGALIFVYDASGDFVAAAATASDGAYLIDDLALDVTYTVDVFLSTTTSLATADGTNTGTPTSGAPTVTLDFNLP